MKLSAALLLAISTGAFAAPVSRSSLANAQSSVDVMLQHLQGDREVAEHAFRTLQTKVLDYRQSVEGYQTWMAYVAEQEKAVRAAEAVRQFLRKVEGLHGVQQDVGFQIQGLL
jgi:hypothetical protein